MILCLPDFQQEVEYSNDSEYAKPEPQEDVDLFVNDVDGENTLGVVIL